MAAALNSFNAPTLAAAMNNFGASELAAAMNSLSGKSSAIREAATKLADAVSSIPNIPELITGAVSASVSLTNEAGFAQTLAREIGRELADEIAAEIARLMPGTNPDGTPKGP